jgi:hypothetical protein
MTEPEFDKDGYPTNATLRAIKAWDCSKAEGRTALMKFVQKAWRWPNLWRPGRRWIRISTGGWSGNEALIDAMSENRLFWAMNWVESR